MALPVQRTFDDLGASLHRVPFCVLDLETTGGSPADCEITEIGAVRYLAGEATGTFHTLVNPGVPIPPFITVLTGITEIMVVEAPKIGEALPAFLEFIGDAVVVGHNVRFDMSFLDAAARRLGYDRLSNTRVDTAALARRLVRQEVRNLKLATLAAHFRSPVAPTHRALDDARATAHVFWALLERAGTLGISHLEDLVALQTARGAAHYAKIRLTDGLPRKPGVYLFRDRDDRVLYVGKAKNLRTRVRSYFYGDGRKTTGQMLRLVEHIEHRVCATELEAEITELRLIHQLAPRYNRRSRPPKSSHWVKLTKERFPRLSLVRTMRAGDGDYLGPYRSRRRAERVMTAIWDAVPIRRCLTRNGATSAACSFAQLGVALCPCRGDVAEEDYAAVVDTVRRGIAAEPLLLLGPLETRMTEFSDGRRYEEAALARDRHRALAHALRQRRRWQALQEAGTLWAEDDEGNGALIERGRLVSAWNDTSSPPLLRVGGDDDAQRPEVAPDVTTWEEAHLVWRWLTTGRVRLVDATGAPSLPALPVPEL